MKLSGLVLVKRVAYWFCLILLLMILYFVIVMFAALLDHGIWLIVNYVPKSSCTDYQGVH
jgi:hypothetical protein